MVIKNILYLSFNLDRVFVIHVKAKLMVCYLRSNILLLQYIGLISILASALLMMLQRFGMICLMMYVQPLLSTYLERSSKPITLQKPYPPKFLLFRVLFHDPCCLGLMIMDCCFFCIMRLKPFCRWRLSTIKVLLDLE